MIEIESLSECDFLIDAVADLMFEEFKETHEYCFGVKTSSDFLENILKPMIEIGLPCFVAHNGKGELLGACNIVINDLGFIQNNESLHNSLHNSLWFGNFVVHKHRRGQGIGKKLIEKSIEWVKNNNNENISLYLWCHTKNLKQFYRRCGFKYVTNIKSFMNYNEIFIMTLV